MTAWPIYSPPTGGWHADLRATVTHAHLTQQEAVRIFSALQRPGLLRTSFFIPASDASTLIRMINSAGAPQKCVRSVKKRSRSRNLGVNYVFAIIILVLVSESEPSDSLQYHPGPSTNHERSRYHGSCHPKRCPTAPIRLTGISIVHCEQCVRIRRYRPQWVGQSIILVSSIILDPHAIMKEAGIMEHATSNVARLRRYGYIYRAL